MDQHAKFALDFQQWLFDLMANGNYKLEIFGELNDVGAFLFLDGHYVAETWSHETPTDAMKDLIKQYPRHA
jgi:hypothetical protein